MGTKANHIKGKRNIIHTTKFKGNTCKAKESNRHQRNQCEIINKIKGMSSKSHKTTGSQRKVKETERTLMKLTETKQAHKRNQKNVMQTEGKTLKANLEPKKSKGHQRTQNAIKWKYRKSKQTTGNRRKVQTNVEHTLEVKGNQRDPKEIDGIHLKSD